MFKNIIIPSYCSLFSILRVLWDRRLRLNFMKIGYRGYWMIEVYLFREGCFYGLQFATLLSPDSLFRPSKSLVLKIKRRDFSLFLTY